METSKSQAHLPNNSKALSLAGQGTLNPSTLDLKIKIGPPQQLPSFFQELPLPLLKLSALIGKTDSRLINLLSILTMPLKQELLCKVLGALQLGTRRYSKSIRLTMRYTQ